jgi:hypothetical protein
MVKEACTVPYDPTPPAKTKSTYDAIAESCTVEYVEPVRSTRPTTHDMVMANYTGNAVPNRRGDSQIYAAPGATAREYIYDGHEWKLLEDMESELEVPDHQFVGECVIELIKNDDHPESIYVQAKQAASLALDVLGRE